MTTHMQVRGFEKRRVAARALGETLTGRPFSDLAGRIDGQIAVRRMRDDYETIGDFLDVPSHDLVRLPGVAARTVERIHVALGDLIAEMGLAADDQERGGVSGGQASIGRCVLQRVIDQEAAGSGGRYDITLRNGTRILKAWQMKVENGVASASGGEGGPDGEPICFFDPDEVVLATRTG